MNAVGALCTDWARIRADARIAGRPTTPQDAWIAATAPALDAPPATDNRRHYGHVQRPRLPPRRTSPESDRAGAGRGEAPCYARATNDEENRRLRIHECLHSFQVSVSLTTELMALASRSQWAVSFSSCLRPDRERE